MRIPSCKTLIVKSKCTKPSVNLAFEDWLFRSGPQEQMCLLLWRNEPCVVIGRNQNPWLECNVELAKELGIPILRRYSGGGTVYHDLGNSLYSVMMPKGIFSRDRYAHFIVRALARLRLNLNVSPRHDIFYGGNKISGSAYRITKDRAYHHGTMLLSTDLTRLRTILKSPLIGDDNTSVTSVISPVKNIGDGLDHERFCSLCKNQFGLEESKDSDFDTIEVDEQDIKSIPGIQAQINELTSDQWTFDKTLPFDLKLPNGLTIKIEEGCISESSNPKLIGQRLSVPLLRQLLIEDGIEFISKEVPPNKIFLN